LKASGFKTPEQSQPDPAKACDIGSTAAPFLTLIPLVMTDPLHSEPPVTPDLLASFRVAASRRRIQSVEKTLLWIVSVHLVFLPWAIGSVHGWSQSISGALAVLGFAVALWPRNYPSEHVDQPAFRLLTWPRLVTFPVFWAGLGLMFYVLIQALNPAQRYVKQWVMEPAAHPITWLPSSVAAPFVEMNAWRILIMLGSAWLLVCTIWIGFTRRRTLQILFTVLAANGAVLSLLGMLQRFDGNGKIMWFWSTKIPMFFSTFIYKNHAGAYLNLTLAVSSALTTWYYVRGIRRLEKSNPAGLFAFFTVFIAFAVVMSYSRGATSLLLAFLLLLVLGCSLQHFRGDHANPRTITIFLMLILFAAFIKFGGSVLRFDRAQSGMAKLFKGQDSSIESRVLASKASWEMLRANWLEGYGAGSFRYYFPPFQQHYPSIAMLDDYRLFWQFAHNDILQFPIELGVLGMSFIIFSMGYFLRKLFQYHFWRNPLAAVIMLGGTLTLVHAWFDFVFSSAAVLITWSALWPAAVRWSELEEASGAPPRTSGPTVS
jgi:hypothetical protein